ASSTNNINRATIESFIDNLALFNWYPNSSTHSITTDHPIYLLIHQLVPKDLSNIFKTFLKKQKLFAPLLLNTLELFFNDINEKIWKFRCNCFKIWKESYGITKHDFKTYSRSDKTTKRRFRKQVRPQNQNVFTPLQDNQLPTHNFITSHLDWIRWTSS